MLDSKIIGGLVVDGTGEEPYRADVGIRDGKIVEVRRTAGGAGGIESEASETLDASGRIVTPGFVDIHTHYDGQVTWDPLLEPSSVHGVTTVVSGNCGVGFAPVRPGSEEWLIALMEGVEDIPGSALTEGMTWGWESFPEYLDRSRAVASLRSTWAPRLLMDRSAPTRWVNEEPATSRPPPRTSPRCRGDRAGRDRGRSARASRPRGRSRIKAMDGEPVPGTYAAEDELFGIGRAMARGGRARCSS